MGEGVEARHPGNLAHVVLAFLEEVGVGQFFLHEFVQFLHEGGRPSGSGLRAVFR